MKPCPTCGVYAGFQAHRLIVYEEDGAHSDYWLICRACGAPTDTAELDAQKSGPGAD